MWVVSFYFRTQIGKNCLFLIPSLIIFLSQCAEMLLHSSGHSYIPSLAVPTSVLSTDDI